MPKKTERGDSFFSPGTISYAEKGTAFIFQFPAPNDPNWPLKFHRSLYTYFGQFVWTEKSHFNSSVSFMKRRLKIGILQYLG